MNKRVVWFAVIALLCAGAVSAATYVGYSGTFGVDNTKAWAWVPSSGSSPYSGGSLVRGQLHCHRISDVSSYSISSAALANKYIALGYRFVAQTEHHNKPGGISPEFIGWQGWAPNSTEITNWESHVLAVGTSQGTTASMIDYPDTGNKAYDTAMRVSRVHGRSGLAFVAHPDSVPYALSAGDLLAVMRTSRPDGIGIYTPGNDSQGKWNRVIADYGRPVWGYVEDDYHPDTLSGWKLGRTWMAVPGSAGEWWGNIKERLRGGNSYCYWSTGGRWSGGSPPTMHVAVSMSGSQPVVSVSFDQAVNRIEFVGWNYTRFGALQSKDNASSDSYTASGREKFVRVLARKDFSGGTLWMASQPVMITRSGYISGYGASFAEAAPQATSPELIVRYLEQEELPTPPDAGYVGPAYEVRTSDGQVPSGATLQLSFDGEDLSALGGTQYLAIYWYSDQAQAWGKVGGTVDPATATIEASITQLGKYCIGADLPTDTTAPQVWIDNPPYAASVPVDTAILATVNDDLGAWRVKFYMNDHLLAEDTDSSDGWGTNLKASDYCTGDWTLKAVAEDLAGNFGTAETPIHIVSSTSPPTISFVSPNSGQVLSGTATVTGICSDDVVVASVALYADNTLLGYGELDGSGGWSAEIDTTHLADGTRLLKAIVDDYPGNQAEATVPVGVNNGAVTTPIGSVKSAAEDSAVRFADAIVVADKSIVGDGFYVEAINRASGIKVLSTADIHVGDLVSIVGTKSTDGHEPVVQGLDILRVSSGNTLPKPIGTYGKLILRAPDSIGKIVKLCGRRTGIDSASPIRWFTLDDGSGASVTCRLADGVTLDTTKTLHIVTGVASVEDVSGAASLVVLVTKNSDIVGF